MTQLIIFELADREYALPVENVSEVLRMVSIAPVPEAPPWMPGVINLRGRVVPVVDLRSRLALPVLQYGINTPIIVSESEGSMLGLVADAVVELLTVPLASVEPPPERMSGPTSSVSGVARAGERLILLFDLERLYAGAAAAVPAS